MRRDFALVGALWVTLTIIGELLAALVDIYPQAMSDKGDTIQHAFRVLVYMSVPVFTFVLAVLVYTVLFHRVADQPDEDGPPMHGRGAVPLAWFGVTAGLTIAVIIYPGLVEIPEIFGDHTDEPPLIVEVTGVQWAWLIDYPEQNVSTVNEMVLPVDRDVTFMITSDDVLHSFWVPSFLMKMDAVPGKTTTVTLRPTVIGEDESNPMLRLQCTELCGLGHSRMRSKVSVRTEAEFEEWVSARSGGAGPGGPTPAPDAQQIAIVGENILFDIDEIIVESESQVVVSFDNRDPGPPHNWALYESEEAALSAVPAIAGSPIVTGPVVQEIVFDPPEPGTYFFRCDVHPVAMTGTFEVQ
jgi:cytochrome c oxidase subunit 2